MTKTIKRGTELKVVAGGSESLGLDAGMRVTVLAVNRKERTMCVHVRSMDMDIVGVAVDHADLELA
jgi:ribosomal protein L25 (general stress protein Ctc)